MKIRSVNHKFSRGFGHYVTYRTGKGPDFQCVVSEHVPHKCHHILTTNTAIVRQEQHGNAILRTFGYTKVYFGDRQSTARAFRFNQWVPAPGITNDICSYCGTDNGPGGELRSGWDCYSCHSN